MAAKSKWPSKYIEILRRATLDSRHSSAQAIVELVRLKISGDYKHANEMLNPFPGKTIEERVANMLARSFDEMKAQGVPGLSEEQASFLFSFFVDMYKARR